MFDKSRQFATMLQQLYALDNNHQSTPTFDWQLDRRAVLLKNVGGHRPVNYFLRELYSTCNCFIVASTTFNCHSVRHKKTTFEGQC